MSYIEQAIKEARENGWWLPAQTRFHYRRETGEFCDAALYSVFLDPLFWQALEKAKHWYAGEWKQKAMSFFEHVVCDDKDAESFFTELLR